MSPRENPSPSHQPRIPRARQLVPSSLFSASSSTTAVAGEANSLIICSGYAVTAARQSHGTFFLEYDDALTISSEVFASVSRATQDRKYAFETSSESDPKWSEIPRLGTTGHLVMLPCPILTKNLPPVGKNLPGQLLTRLRIPRDESCEFVSPTNPPA